MTRPTRDVEDNYAPPSVALDEVVALAVALALRRRKGPGGRRQMIHPHAQDYACDHRCYELLPTFEGTP